MWDLGLSAMLLFLVFVALISFLYAKPKKNLPPGPWSLPVFGNILQLTNKAHLQMAKWANQYGKMYKLQLGSHTAIVLNDLKLIKEVLSDNNFSIRPHIPLIEMLSGGCQGIITTNGAVWEEQRRWTLRTLRDYGFGKTSMEGMIMDEVYEVIERLKRTNEEYIAIKEYFDLAVLNALWTLLTGERRSQTDPKFRDVLDAFDKFVPLAGKSGFLFAPWLKYIFPSVQKQLEDVANGIMNMARVAISSHFENHKEGESKDFIDEYINEIKRTTDPQSSFFQKAGRNNLEGTVSDLIQGGSETTSNTIVWLLAYLCQHPEIQEKLQEELDSVVGTSRQVTLSDKPDLPYTESVILETLRHSSLIAGGVQHSAIVDKEVDGYLIPQGAWIMTNIYFVHHNPAVWGDPEKFRPERFLSPDGKKVIRHEELIPFQLGRRECLGKGLAQDSLFLFSSNILQKFSVDKLEKEDPEPIPGLFLVAKEYHFSFKSRMT